ncbi:tonB-system energizer ExbB, partial [Streptomyces sp. SID4985]|nr:tonB-system energizer ExbB [Streptomyces sp. SID4985]
MHRTARALTAATALVITGPTAAFASGWGAHAPAAPAARAVVVAAACDAPAVPRAEIPEDVP